MRDRQITFTNVGIQQGSRVWRNSETGVEIIKGKNFAEVGLYYVCVPTQAEAGGPRRMVSYQTTLTAARAAATGYVHHWRSVITAAHIEAREIHSSRYWEVATAGMDREPAFT